MVPAVQALHVAVPVDAAIEPAAQAVQMDCPAVLKRPALQAAQTDERLAEVVALKVPAAHAVQTVAATAVE